MGLACKRADRSGGNVAFGRGGLPQRRDGGTFVRLHVCAAKDLRTGRAGSQEYLLANPDHHEWDVSTIIRASPVENDCGIARWTIIESPDLVALVSTTFAPLP